MAAHDFIVVGAASAGCAVAGRLTRTALNSHRPSRSAE